jgi:biopolymer transport protein ExbB/TolQ
MFILGAVLVVVLLLFYCSILQLKIVAKTVREYYNRSEGMGQKEKLIKKLLSKPKNFTFSEAESLLAYFDYVRSNKGKTSGSRIMFISEKHASILLHKPHPRKELLEYQLKQLIAVLKQEGLL